MNIPPRVLADAPPLGNNDSPCNDSPCNRSRSPRNRSRSRSRSPRNRSRSRSCSPYNRRALANAPPLGNNDSDQAKKLSPAGHNIEHEFAKLAADDPNTKVRVTYSRLFDIAIDATQKKPRNSCVDIYDKEYFAYLWYCDVENVSN
jgi:hypothetical protein